MANQEAQIDLGIAGLGPAEHIGRGGFADVYRAEQIGLRRTVAVKVLRAQATDPDAEARFERECHAVGAVSDHPHIVGVHEGGFTRNGRAYLVMEYLPGGSLYDRLIDDGPLPVPEIVDIGIKIGKALAVAHRNGVLHRDVKPANIMISAYGEPALGDFGIARIDGGHQTATGMVTASFAHAAPEVLEGQAPTAGSDIYSLGSTIFELMTGQPPYYDPNDASIWPLMKRILSEPIPSPESVGMSASLGAVFSKATARPVGDRYADAEDLVSDLLAVAADPSALRLRQPTDGGFVPAPRPPGRRGGEPGGAGGASIGVPDQLPPAAKPDLTSVLWGDVDASAASAAGGVEFDLDVETMIADGGEFRTGTDSGWVDQRPPSLDPFATQRPPEAVAQAQSAPLATEPSTAEPSTKIYGLAGSAPGDEYSQPSQQPLPNPATTMDLPPSFAGRQPSSGRKWVILSLASLVVAFGALVGGLFMFTDLGDRVAGGPSDVGIPAGDVVIAVDAAASGPLLEGTSYDVEISELPLDASLQLVIDGQPMGEPIEATSGAVARFEAPAGRHSVAVELITESAKEISNTVGFYALSAQGPTAGYRVTLASIPTGDDAWQAALDGYDRLLANGHPELELIVSDETSALADGYWTISATGFGTDADAAEAYCERFDMEVPIDCYVSFVDHALS